MTVTYGQPVQVGNSYLINWSSDLPSPVTYRVWINGVDMGTTQATAWTVQPGDQIQVSDDPDASAILTLPRAAVLQWLKSTGSPDHYRVDEYIDSAWIERIRIKHAADLPYYQFKTRDLEDDTLHQFRVTPVSAGGQDGTARTYSFLMVRRPDAPELSYSYDNETGIVTIAAA